MKKKMICDLRDELINAGEHIDMLHIYDDHIVVAFPFCMKNVDEKKIRLKSYIQKTFDVITVDVFTQYIVIWHYAAMLERRHQYCKGRLR